MIKKVLVTGGNGQLGKTLKELFKNNTIGLDFVFATKEVLDITKKDDIDVFFYNTDFDYCINCAAYTNVEQAENTPEIAYSVNAEGVRNLAEICNQYRIILIHISTDYVFDGEKDRPYQIDDQTNPINVYGKSKLLGEKYIQNIMTHYFIVRTSWLYSKKYGHNFYKTIVEKTKTEKELFITTEQKGCPTNTVNLSRFIIELIELENKSFGIFHFCDNNVMTWYDFAKHILNENNKLYEVKIYENNDYETKAKRPKYSVLKVT